MQKTASRQLTEHASKTGIQKTMMIELTRFQVNLLLKR